MRQRLVIIISIATVLGLLIAGALAAWVPKEFWQAFFLSADPLGSKIVGPLIGPIVAMVAFVCSVGNVPLAAVLWNGGISFGGVISFIYADLLVVPLIIIYVKYYGARATVYIVAIFYAAMVISGIAVDLIFSALGIVPSGARPPSAVEHAMITWNYTSWLDIVAAIVFAMMLVLYMRRSRAH